MDEIAALVDFGMDRERLRSGLERLDVLRRRTKERGRDARPDDTVAPATSAQRRLWLAAQLMENPAAYNETGAVRLRGPLDVAALRAAVDGLVERHAGLRTVFRAEEQEEGASSRSSGTGSESR